MSAHEAVAGAAHGHDHQHQALDWHDVLGGAVIILLLFGALAILYRRKGR